MVAKDMTETPKEPTEDGIAALLEAAIAVHGLPVQPEWLTAALAHLTVIAEAARLVEAFPLDDEAEPGPVFTP